MNTYEFYPPKMSFESEQRAKQKDAEFDLLVVQRLNELGEPWTIEKMTAAINWASEQQDPNHGELVYEIDSDQGL